MVDIISGYPTLDETPNNLDRIFIYDASAGSLKWVNYSYFSVGGTAYTDADAIDAINADTDHGSTATHAPSDLTQEGATDGQAIAWNATSGQWEPTTMAAGGGATELSDLNDVNTSTVTNRNVLVADGVDWESRALTEADISDLGSYITDYTVTQSDVTDHQLALAIFSSQITDLDSITVSWDNVILKPSEFPAADHRHYEEDILDLDHDAVSLQGVDLDTTVGTPSDGDILVYRAAGSDFVLEAKPASGSNPALNDVTDVNITTVSDDDVLTYDSTTSKWINQALPASYTDSDAVDAINADTDHGSTATHNPSDLTQESATDGQAIVWNNTAGQWEPQTIASGGASELSDLSDVNTSTPTNRNVLIADGTDFESRALTEADISDLGSYITDYTVTESDVTGHETALTIAASQITGLNYYTDAEAITAINTDADHGSTAQHDYYTDADAKAAVVNDSITNGNTDTAPSENAVFDALALKSDTSHTHTGTDVDLTGVMAVMGFNMASLHGLSVLDMTDGIVDEFNDETGIDLVNSTGQTYYNIGYYATYAYWNPVDAVSVDNQYSTSRTGSYVRGLYVAPNDSKYYFGYNTSSTNLAIGSASLDNGNLNNSLSYISDQIDNASQSGSGLTDLDDFTFSNDGTKLYALESGDSIVQYSIATAWADADDLNPVYDTDKKFTLPANRVTYGIAISHDGDYLYMLYYDTTSSEKHIAKYEFTTAKDITSLSLVQTSSALTGTDGVNPISIGGDDDFIYTCNYDDIYWWSMSTGGDLSTLSSQSIKTLTTTIDDLHGIAMNSDGTDFFVAGEKDGSSLLYTWQYSITAVSNITLISDSFTASTEPDTANLIIRMEDVDAVTLNTDILGYVSRNNGTTWTQGTLTEYYSDGDHRIVEAEIDVSAQSTGTTMEYKIVTANLKEMNIHAVSLQWS